MPTPRLRALATSPVRIAVLAKAAPLASTAPLARAASLALTFALSLAACSGKPSGHPSTQVREPNRDDRRDLELNDEQAAYLEAVARRADENPDDFAALRASGLAHMNFTLSGVLRLQARAEQDLEAAFALDSSDPMLNRSLGRFYNMRAVAGDFSKGDKQVEVYGALLGDTPPEQMDDAAFVAYSFFQLGQILDAQNRGRSLEALRRVKALEARLAERVAEQPDNIEFHALAGNFAFFFAGNIPIDRRRRVQEAVAYFEVLRERWDELRPGAKDPLHCPNTYENFMFELAEGYMVLGEGARARPIYDELATIEAPRTRAKELVAHVAAERLRNFDGYLGEIKLMPPWPSDEANCVVCHAWSSEVSLASLYALEPIALSDVPSSAQYKPIPAGTEAAGPGSPGAITAGYAIADREQLPPQLAAVVEARCAPCHFPGGEVFELLDLSSADALRRAAPWVSARVIAGDMPPDGGLEPSQRELIRAWAEQEG